MTYAEPPPEQRMVTIIIDEDVDVSNTWLPACCWVAHWLLWYCDGCVEDRYTWYPAWYQHSRLRYLSHPRTFTTACNPQGELLAGSHPRAYILRTHIPCHPPPALTMHAPPSPPP